MTGIMPVSAHGTQWGTLVPTESYSTPPRQNTLEHTHTAFGATLD